MRFRKKNIGFFFAGQFSIGMPRKKNADVSEPSDLIIERRRTNSARQKRKRDSETPDEIAERRRKDAERKRQKRAAEKENVRPELVAGSVNPGVSVEVMDVGDDCLQHLFENDNYRLFENDNSRVGQDSQESNQNEIHVQNQAEAGSGELQRPVRKARSYRLALKPIVNDSQVQTLHIGPMNHACQFCHAVHFKGEKPRDGKFTLCCNKGKVQLPPPGDVDPLLKGLLTNCHPKSPHFMKNIIRYNNAFAFASIAYKKAHPLAGRGPLTIRIQGQICHNVSAARPNSENQTPSYSQLYFLDPTEALEIRRKHPANEQLDAGLLRQFDIIFRRDNPYAGSYKNLRDAEEEERRASVAEGRPLLHVGLTFHTDKKQDQRRYNPPSSNDIACVFKNADGLPPSDRDFVARLHIPRQGSHFVNMSATHPMCDPMTYPFVFPRGR